MKALSEIAFDAHHPSAMGCWQQLSSHHKQCWIRSVRAVIKEVKKIENKKIDGAMERFHKGFAYKKVKK